MPNARRACVTYCGAKEDYNLLLEFSDGTAGSVYLGNLLEIGAFKRWRDVREFKRVQAIDGAPVWECGARLDPEILYQDVIQRATIPAARNRRRKLNGKAKPKAYSAEALQSLSALQPIADRLEGCAALFINARGEIGAKVERIKSARDKYHEQPSYWEGAEELRDSGKLGRVIEDLEVIRASIGASVSELRRLTEGA